MTNYKKKKKKTPLNYNKKRMKKRKRKEERKVEKSKSGEKRLYESNSYINIDANECAILSKRVELWWKKNERRGLTLDLEWSLRRHLYSPLYVFLLTELINMASEKSSLSVRELGVGGESGENLSPIEQNEELGKESDQYYQGEERYQEEEDQEEEEQDRESDDESEEDPSEMVRNFGSNPLMDRIQLALYQQLCLTDERVTLELREKVLYSPPNSF